MKKSYEGHWFFCKNSFEILKRDSIIWTKYSQMDDFNLIGYSNSEFDEDKENGM